MAGLNVSKWQASARGPFYDPVLQFPLRMIRTALDDCYAARRAADPAGVLSPAHQHLWNAAVMARDWFARQAPEREADPHGWYLSFDGCCHVLGMTPERTDAERVAFLALIDREVDFDRDELHALVDHLSVNPPREDEVEEELFEGFRVVPAVDQGSLFAAFGQGAE